MRVSTILVLAVAYRSRLTSSSGPELPACHVCGAGFVLKNGDAIIELPKQPNITCSDFERAALGGMINPVGCSLVTGTIIDACDCQELAVTFPSCSVCEGTDILVNEENKLILPGFPLLSCREFAVFGAYGFIDPDTCLKIAPMVLSQCGCEKFPITHPPCPVCGKGFQIAAPTAIIAFPGYQAQSCQEFSDAGEQGFVDPIICPVLLPQVEASCGCQESSFENPSCSVCGSGHEVAHPDARMLSIHDHSSVTCREWQESGYNGEISEADCSGFFGITVATCGCTEKSQPHVAKLCFVCGDEDADIIDGDRVILLQNQPSISCDDFALVGVDNRISEEACPQIVETVKSACWCNMSNDPLANPHPGVCPGTAWGGCSVCGEGHCVTRRNAVISLPNRTSSLCGVLEDAGRLGLIQLDQCSLLANTIWDTCGCAAGEYTTNDSSIAPSPGSFPSSSSPSPIDPTWDPVPPSFQFIFETFPPEAPTLPPAEPPPTAHPTIPPVEPPTAHPSVRAVEHPVVQPTITPVEHPTANPSIPPVEPPTSRPSVGPVEPPVVQPTIPPAEPPTANPSISPVEPPTSHPSVRPVEPPVSQPNMPPPAEPPTASPTLNIFNRPSLGTVTEVISITTNAKNDDEKKGKNSDKGNTNNEETIQPDKQADSQEAAESTTGSNKGKEDSTIDSGEANNEDQESKNTKGKDSSKTGAPDDTGKNGQNKKGPSTSTKNTSNGKLSVRKPTATKGDKKRQRRTERRLGDVEH